MTDDCEKKLLYTGNIAIGSDNAGLFLKKEASEYLINEGRRVLDLGANDPGPADYPDIAREVGSVLLGKAGGKGNHHLRPDGEKRGKLKQTQQPVLHMFTGPGEMNRFATGLILEQAALSVQRKGLFTMVLSGGRTPAGLYELLSRDNTARSMPWEKTHIFWGDERLVPRHSENSNFKLARDKLLSRVKIPKTNVHPMSVDLESPEENARISEQELLDFFRSHGPSEKAGRQKPFIPTFDLILLGLGRDGHTASLFPGSPVLEETSRMIAAVTPGPDIFPHVPRLTLTLPVLNAARMIVFLVSGQDKHPALKQVFEPVSGTVPPAGLVRPKEELIWLVHPSLV